MDVDKLRRHTLQLLPIGRRCCILLQLILYHVIMNVVHWVGVTQLTVHFGPAYKFLLLRLTRTVIVRECTKSLTWRSDNVAATTRALMIRIDGRLV